MNAESDRAEVVAALRCVDAVTVFDETTAMDLARALQPDVYVKGGDYSGDPSDSRYPPEGDVVTRAGGTVVIVDLVEGRSTTSMLSRISGRSGDDPC